MSETNKTKVCTKCNKELPISEFYKDNRTKDGLYSNCKECHSKYYKTNKQHYNQYHKQYYQTNKEHYSQYRKQYYKTNKEHISQQHKEYDSQFKGYYLYIILDKQDKVVYVGETTNYYKRLMRHLSENVNATKELFANGDWGSIQYLNVEHIVDNEMELKALENALIELYEPRLNTLLNIIRDIDNDRLFSIVTTLHSMNNEWEIFRTNV